MFRRCIVTLGLSSLVTTVVSAQHQDSHKSARPAAATIPASTRPLSDTIQSTDSTGIQGVLPNGLRYYIRKNSRPEQRAELRLVVKAGSLQEDDDQRGLAHFVEHMAFNGTKHFKKNELIHYLESIGVKFGADVNAFTSFETTQYTLRVPTDRPDAVEKAFLMLGDWAYGITFDSADVVAERGVILEEWRRRLGVGSRLLEKQLPFTFAGSRYADRLPIGLPKIITTANPSTLRRYYEEWYRPDLMAVVVVGDLDPARAEALIRANFSALRNPANARPVQEYTVPDHQGARFSILADSEVSRAELYIQYKLPKFGTRTIGDAVIGTSRNFFTSILSQRLSELRRSADPPFVSAGASYGVLGPNLSVLSLSVGSGPGGLMRGISVMLPEVERIARFGVTPEELDRQRRSIIRNAERTYLQSETLVSSAYVDSYIAHFMSGQPIMDPASSLALTRQVVASVTGDQIRQWAEEWRRTDGRNILILLPLTPDAAAPDSASLLATWDQVKQARLTAYVEPPAPQQFLDTLPQPGKILSRREHSHGITEWTLSNGIQVLLRPSTRTTDEVLFSGMSYGGFYQNLDKGWASATMVTEIMKTAGVGGMTRMQLMNQLVGRNVVLDFGITPLAEYVSVGTTLNDLELALQLTYMVFTQPSVDTIALAAMQAQTRTRLRTKSVDPMRDFQDTVGLVMVNHHPLIRSMSEAIVDSMDAYKALEVYRDRFGDAGDFRFVFVGNFEPDSIAPLIERYLGGLPAAGRKETFRDMGFEQPKLPIRRTVVGGHEPKTLTVLAFYGPYERTTEDELRLGLLGEVLKMRLRERLREDLGGTYTVGVAVQTNTIPKPGYTIQVEFTSAPERAEELARATLDVIRGLQRKPALAHEVHAIREATLRDLEMAHLTDRFWLTSIHELVDLHLPFSEIDRTMKLIRQWTPRDVQLFAKKYLDVEKYARFDLVPVPEAEPVTTP